MEKKNAEFSTQQFLKQYDSGENDFVFHESSYDMLYASKKRPQFFQYTDSLPLL